MKSLVKYLKKREAEILFLLRKAKEDFTVNDFHKLRVEIKKLNAFFEMVDFCVSGFKRGKKYKPFRLIFKQAGRVRELQVEEEMLSAFFMENSLQDYRLELSRALEKEKESFFSINDQKKQDLLQDKILKTIPFLKKINRKKMAAYMEFAWKKIEKILEQENLLSENLHFLRKRIKKLLYNRVLVSKGGGKKTVSITDDLSDMLGKWNDGQVILNRLEAAMNSGKIKPGELLQIENLKAQIMSNNAQMFDQIKLSIHS
ncbi:hypothetical protein P872_18685 [Rhodonellum psychrophilum GCM71 = DSM 17998]|uniref:CHAD domain-containing protein n=2 Tax=Rhodonellum TaxID=336827 RepID=U5C2B9_9BACT|nr:hypothetical protein P872_18685 [Rhodonellum psychrophilum GCM71 = DSM 17998]SDZ48850.1 CHAD domain-containing protein [Rhodonellum ikkaensis]